MSASGQVERPTGKFPRSSERCPLCGVGPYVGHLPRCPWRLWAESVRADAIRRRDDAA